MRKLSPRNIIKENEELLNESIATMHNFYELAIKRNEIMVSNMLKAITMDPQIKSEDDEENAAIMVVGGFHSEGITEILRNKGISYRVILPNTDKITGKDLYNKKIKEQAKWFGEEENLKLKKINSNNKANTKLALARNYSLQQVEPILDEIIGMRGYRDIDIVEMGNGDLVLKFLYRDRRSIERRFSLRRRGVFELVDSQDRIATRNRILQTESVTELHDLLREVIKKEYHGFIEDIVRKVIKKIRESEHWMNRLISWGIRLVLRRDRENSTELIKKLFLRDATEYIIQTYGAEEFVEYRRIWEELQKDDDQEDILLPTLLYGNVGDLEVSVTNDVAFENQKDIVNLLILLGVIYKHNFKDIGNAGPIITEVFDSAMTPYFLDLFAREDFNFNIDEIYREFKKLFLFSDILQIEKKEIIKILCRLLYRGINVKQYIRDMFPEHQAEELILEIDIRYLREVPSRNIFEKVFSRFYTVYMAEQQQGEQRERSVVVMWGG